MLSKAVWGVDGKLSFGPMSVQSSVLKLGGEDLIVDTREANPGREDYKFQVPEKIQWQIGKGVGRQEI